MSYAVVGGHVDPDDGANGLKAAKRELLEELGMESDEWINFGKFRTDVNRGGGFCHTFLARKARKTRAQSQGDELEEMHIHYATKKELMQYFQKGLFKEAKWSNTAGLALVWMLENMQ